MARIAFRCDASSEIGFGHLARCRALAAGAPEHECRFFGLGSEEQGLIHAFNPDFIVVDQYDLGSDWERQWRVPVLAFEDLPNRVHDCRYLLDANPDAADYSNFIPSTCSLLTGPEFAVIRPEVVAKRPPEPPRARVGYRIVVAMGGSDPANATQFFAYALAGMDAEFIVGPGFKHPVDFPVLRNPADYLDRLQNADLVIGAPGGSAWERACLGVASLVVVTAENQTRIDKAFTDRGYHVSLGPIGPLMEDQAREQVAWLLASRERRQALINASWNGVDGLGAQRVWESVDLDAVAL